MMEKAIQTIKLLKLPWEHEKLEKVMDIDEVKYKTYLIQGWMTCMFLIMLSFAIWCGCYVWKAEKRREKRLITVTLEAAAK